MTADRPLGFSESFFHFTHRLGAYVIAVGARLRGPIREEMLREALVRAQERHPLLRVHVVEERGVLSFREAGTSAIPLRVLRDASSDAFERTMEDEIARPLEGGRAPRLRALLVLGDGDAFDVILAMDHAVCDGVSVISLFEDLLAALQGAPPRPALPPLPSLETLLAARGPLEKWTRKNDRQVTPLVPKKPPRGPRRTRLLVRDLDEAATARLADRCRAERTSINGALTAAALIAMQREAARVHDDGAAGTRAAESAHLGVITNVSLRDRADRAEPRIGGEHVGNFVSFVQTYHDVSPTTPLWDLARECRDVIAEHVAEGEPARRLAPGQLVWWQRGYLRHVGPHLHGGVGNALAVSNTGRLPLGAAHGAFTLRGVYAASAQHVIGSSLALFVWSVASAIQVVAGCVEPLVPKARAARIVDDLVATLRL